MKQSTGKHQYCNYKEIPAHGDLEEYYRPHSPCGTTEKISVGYQLSWNKFTEYYEDVCYIAGTNMASL